MSTILDPLAMRTLMNIQKIGVNLTAEQAIQFLTDFKKDAAELTAASNGNGGG